MSGIFTISLDFELHWGGFEKWPLAGFRLPVSGSTGNGYNQYFINTRSTIPQMLSLFEQYGVHVTWTTVGMLCHSDKESLVKNIPAVIPSYENKELSAYNFIDQIGIGENENDDPFHFADSLVKQILSTENQELGSHTFSHYYCNEAGQTIDQFRADLQSAQMAASAYGVKLSSLVFPRNQFNDDYLKVCYEEGFESVRSNPVDWFWNIESTENESAWKRFSRGLDAYFPVGRKNSFRLADLKVREGFPICIPASRLLRPYRRKEFFLNRLKLERIKSEMNQAAQAGEVYHLWWHPHNFGNYPGQSLQALEELLISFRECQSKFNMTSLNMGELTALIKKTDEKKEAA